MTFNFTRANDVTERHALIVALEAPPNGGKTFSGLRLAKGMAGNKRVAVVDTEGGRTLHLRKEFDFDVTMLDPPHRPARYFEAAKDAQDAGYGALLIDSFSNEWRGIGGVLHWADDEIEAYVIRQRAFAEQKDWTFDESKARNAGKQSSLIRPKTAHKFMMAGLLGLRIPIILSIRGEVSYDADAKKELFKVHMQQGLAFDVTCRFRLMPAAKGIIDLADSDKFKMEGSHAAIFRNGEQLSEKHGEALEAWARNAAVAPAEGDRAKTVVDGLIVQINAATTNEGVSAAIATEKAKEQIAWLEAKRPAEHDRLFENVAIARKRVAGLASQAAAA